VDIQVSDVVTCLGIRGEREEACWKLTSTNFDSSTQYSLSLWLIGTLHAEPEMLISRAWVQSPDPAE